MDKLWVRIVSRHKIVQQTVVDAAGQDIEDCLVEACQKLDLPAPIWLPKHESELGSFQRTHFTEEHFIESIGFDRMEIELFDELGGARRSNDPRNQFD